MTSNFTARAPACQASLPSEQDGLDTMPSAPAPVAAKHNKRLSRKSNDVFNANRAGGHCSKIIVAMQSRHRNSKHERLQSEGFVEN